MKLDDAEVTGMSCDDVGVPAPPSGGFGLSFPFQVLSFNILVPRPLPAPDTHKSRSHVFLTMISVGNLETELCASGGKGKLLYCGTGN